MSLAKINTKRISPTWGINGIANEENCLANDDDVKLDFLSIGQIFSLCCVESGIIHLGSKHSLSLPYGQFAK